MQSNKSYVEIGEQIDQYLTRITPFGFSGAILVAKDNEIVLNKGYNFANNEKKIPNRMDTYFDIGSITKQFTAAAIMKLEMQGQLNTQDKISSYLNSVPQDKSAITIHHLLTHTSGIKDSTGDDYEIIDKEQAIERILNLPLFAVPGENYIYCNDGYTLLAAIIEERTNETYERYVNTNLFQPCGMSSTGYRIPDWVEENVSHGYVSGVDQGKPTEKNYAYWNLMGNGGMLSTTGDFFKWHQALLGNHVFSDEAKKKLFTPFINDYAYGWQVYSTPRGTIIQHDGASYYGTSAKFTRYMDRNLVYILFCNTSFEQHTLAKIVSGKIEKILFEETIHLPTYIFAEKITSTDLSVCEGDYKLPSGGVFKAIAKGNSLQLSSFDQDCLNLLVWDTLDEVNLPELIERSLEVQKESLEEDLACMKSSLSKVLMNLKEEKN
jgi:CubicO group peptidase (beta-lactamase class C family)